MKYLRADGWTILRLAEYFKLDRHSVTYWLRCTQAPSQHRRIPRNTSKKSTAIRGRRKLVLGLLNKREVLKRNRFTAKFRKRRERTVERQPFGSLRQIRKGLISEHGIRVSISTVRNDLRAMGKRARRRRRGPHLTQKHRLARVAFAKRWMHARLDFSDECLISTNDATSGWQWVSKDEQPQHLDHEQGPTQLLVWGVVGTGFRKLIILDDKERLSKESYQAKVLTPAVPELKKRSKAGFLFQQDLARPHCDSERFLHRHGVKTAPQWPAKSCDMSPIETCWSWLKQRVALDAPWGVEELKAAILKAWHDLPTNSIDNAVASFKTRCQQVIRAKGALIKAKKPRW